MPTDITITMPQPIGRGEGTIHADATQEQCEELVNKVENYLKRVADNAPGCCFDGRLCTRHMDGSAPDLRPSIAGGPLITAYIAAELSGWFEPEAPDDIESRIDIVKQKLEAEGVVLGAHVDEAAVATNFRKPDGSVRTGCGANDRAAAIVRAILDPSSAVGELSGAVMGEDYDASAIDRARSEELLRRFGAWNPEAALQESTSDNGRTVEVLQSDDTPTVGHREVLALFNQVEGTTFDRDGFVTDTGEQAFGIDMWYARKLARAMAGGPNATEQYSKLYSAMTAFQVGTYLVLCDGTQRAATIEPAKA